MKKLVCLMMMFLISCSCAHAPRTTKLPVKDKIESVVQVFVGGSEENKGVLASGWAYDEDHILTAGHFCSHYIDGVKEEKLNQAINVRYYDSFGYLTTKSDAKIVKFEFSNKLDACVLELKHHGIPVLKLSLLTDVYRGDKLYAIGAPHGVFPIITEGYVAIPHSKSDSMDGDKLISSIAATQGMSGCPVFNERGRVVGMVVMVDMTFSNITYAVPASLIYKFIK